MHQSIRGSRQTKKAEKGNHRRKQQQGIVTVWGHVGILMTLLR